MFHLILGLGRSSAFSLLAAQSLRVVAREKRRTQSKETRTSKHCREQAFGASSLDPHPNPPPKLEAEGVRERRPAFSAKTEVERVKRATRGRKKEGERVEKLKPLAPFSLWWGTILNSKWPTTEF
jgi:hypothetical protein